MVAGAVALVAVFAACALVYPKTAGELVLLIAVTVTVALAGTLVRSRRAQLDALRDRAAALERERVSAAARAAAAARTALSAVESSSRAALGEMRQLLGVLRAGDAGDYGRSPGLGDLRGLVGSMRRQGVAVTLRPVELGDVPDAVSLAAYRVVQEALTNVVKHGGGGRVTVEVGTSGGAVLVTVEDYADQATPQAEAGLPKPPGEAGQPPGERAGGTGLAGMRERVAGFGGEVSAGPTGDHPGWRVQARIPYGEDNAG